MSHRGWKVALVSWLGLAAFAGAALAEGPSDGDVLRFFEGSRHSAALTAYIEAKDSRALGEFLGFFAAQEPSVLKANLAARGIA
ncbi:MAG: hypothetical protein HY551_02935, partial [Elusimicrobia bacterium]|nr:hypothetical protein [Elusimicrobiota bacterium]